MNPATSALVVTDMQNYYLRPESDFFRYCESGHPGGMEYISRRARETVVPAIQALLKGFRAAGLPVIYLRLCGTDPDRSDLHRLFRESHQHGRAAGFADVYPLDGDPMANVIDEIAPQGDELMVVKTTFSAFTRGNLEATLREKQITTLYMTGLATSQCVETTARDASDRGFEVVHIEDAQADYTETSHHASLYSSAAVCGGDIRSTEQVLAELDAPDANTTGASNPPLESERKYQSSN